MKKTALQTGLVAVLILGGAVAGYHKGWKAGHQMPSPEPLVTWLEVAPTPDGLTLLQRPPEAVYSLDGAEPIGLFPSHFIGPVRIDYGIPLAREPDADADGRMRGFLF